MKVTTSAAPRIARTTARRGMSEAVEATTGEMLWRKGEVGGRLLLEGLRRDE